MTAQRRRRIEAVLRDRLDGWWWRDLPDPSVTVGLTRGPAAPATRDGLARLRPAPQVIPLDVHGVDLRAWRAVAAAGPGGVISVVEAGWLPRPGWLDGLMRHLSDGSVAAIADAPEHAPGDRPQRVDWRTRGWARLLGHVPPAGAILRADWIGVPTDLHGTLRQIVADGGAVVLDPARFRDAPAGFARPSRRGRPVAARARPRTPVSVVVPTVAGRQSALSRCLTAVSNQDLPAEDIEVIVVPNGASASSLPHPPGADLVLPRVDPSAAAARNAGAEAARGELVVFVDDDVLLAPGALRAHLGAQGAPAVTVGPYPPASAPRTLAEQTAFRWWHGFFDRAQRRGRQPTFVDVVTGNMGVPRETFRALGGFDEAFRGCRREDWEFGNRVLKDGLPVVVVPGAGALHAYSMSPRRLIHDAEGEGYGDVLLVRRHPDALEDLPLRAMGAAASRATIAWRRDAILGRAVVGPLERAADAALASLERAGRRRAWLGLLHGLCALAYRAGVQRAIESGHPLPAPVHRETCIDLSRHRRPGSAPGLGRVTLTLGASRLGAFHPRGGQWDVDIVVDRALEMMDRLPERVVDEGLAPIRAGGA